ncbi:MAG: type II toxin-antitoxin system RelE/ParE family toxin [Methanosarcinales archaeon]|uniref:Type II toxin-antitoxin system RelE/ParE family toxin n=1 Tax=Candidatus Ethanoperedens thermophilum TaxID=2766897 RepID=A0A848DAX9_9EURY|nr:type II toxin-antitoxin system RelE/ParE family toxin [Candidatus Ethanoperedens thermophilum]
MKLRAHPLFEKDVKKLDKKDKEKLSGALRKIKENPTRYKSVKGIPNCFRLRIGNLRVVYMAKEAEIWILIVEKRKQVYKEMKKRLR